MNIFATVGRVVIAFMTLTGRLAMFADDAISHCVRPPIYWLLILQQMIRIGYFSLPVVGLTAFFTGAVLCLQIYIGGNRYGAEAFVPQIVVLAIFPGRRRRSSICAQ
jgi:phospholipid/cholesterol/gamma-HCH transport system permease protein